MFFHTSGFTVNKCEIRTTDGIKVKNIVKYLGINFHKQPIETRKTAFKRMLWYNQHVTCKNNIFCLNFLELELLKLKE